MLSFNEKLSEVQIYAYTSDLPLPLFFCERKFYARTHVKITRQWKSALRGGAKKRGVYFSAKIFKGVHTNSGISSPTIDTSKPSTDPCPAFKSQLNDFDFFGDS